MITDVKILDNLYSNPDFIRTLFTDFPITGCGTGKRTIGLKEIDVNTFNNFCDAIFKIHGIEGSNLHVDTFFMEHESHEIDVFNDRWVHIDGKDPDICLSTIDEYDILVSGQIYLTPNPDPEAGTRICKLKPSVNWTVKELMDKTINFYTLPREKYDRGEITLEQYKLEHKQYHDNFETTCDIKNVYNRMVSWKGGTLHGDPMTTKIGKRLNQYFFIRTK